MAFILSIETKNTVITDRPTSIAIVGNSCEKPLLKKQFL